MAGQDPEIELALLEEGAAPKSEPTSHPTEHIDPVPNADTFSRIYIGLVYFFITITFPISIWFCIVMVKEYQRGIWLRLGRLRDPQSIGPGLYIKFPWIDDVIIVDMRVRTLNVVPQSILSKDSVTVTVDAVIYTRVVDPIASILNVLNQRQSTELLGQTTLRNILGTKTLAEILSEREIIANLMCSSLDEATDKWGVKIDRVEVKDVSLPVSMQRSMAAIAEAEREAKARIIAAESEFHASSALKKAANELSSNPAALQLRYLQTLNTISAEHSSTVIFPFPMEFMTLFQQKQVAA